jgi:hypothetical protein
MNASSQSLDGKRFHGVVIEPGKTAGDAETVIFEKGRFRSTACDQYGYGDGAYTVTSSDGGISFKAQTQSAQYGQLMWQGVVRGGRLDGTLTMMRDGRSVGEKWILAGEAS